MLSNDIALRDKEFLKKLDEYPIHETKAKIIVLNYDEAPIGDITGNIENGSITVDGSAACRRSCQLTLWTQDANVNDLDWQIHSKYKLSIGKKNSVDSKYAEWIWFPMGTYVLTDMSMTNKLNGYSISITGKDKTCLIDGSVGGALFADHDFAYQDVVNSDEGTTYKEAIPIYNMIREAVHVYAREPYWNIIINDLEDVSVELLDYKLDNYDAYLYDWASDRDFSDYTSGICFAKPDASQEDNELILNVFSHYEEIQGTDWTYQWDGHWYRVIKKLTYGDTAGYRLTDLTYPSELVINAGGTIVDMLNKVIEMLGEYEFFYDVNGRFIFRRKQIYHNVSWTGVQYDDTTGYYTSSEATQTIYDFTNSNIVESFTNKPKMSNIKNDYVIWGKIGTANNASNSKWPFHLRYAIDDKPKVYHSLSDGYWYMVDGYSSEFFAEKNQNEQAYVEYQEILDDYAEYIKSFTAIGSSDPLYPTNSVTYKNLISGMEGKLKQRFKTVDWRELIYRMAVDYSQAQSRIDELSAVTLNSPVGLYNIHTFDTPSSMWHGMNTYRTQAASADRTWYYDTSSKTFKGYTLIKLEEVNTGSEAAENKDKSGNKIDQGRYGRGQAELTWDEWATSKPHALWYGKNSEIDPTNNFVYVEIYNEDTSRYDGDRANFGVPSGNPWDIHGIDANYQVYGMRFDHWQGFTYNNGTYFQPVIRVTKQKTFEEVSKELLRWEDRLNSDYAIYFTDMLSFWTLYYKTENDLTKDDIPAGFTAGLDYSAQMVSILTSQKFYTYQDTFQKKMKAITENKSRTEDEKREFRNAYLQNYITNLNSIKQTVKDCKVTLEKQKAEASPVYKSYYDSPVVDRLFKLILDDTTGYIALQLRTIPNSYSDDQVITATETNYKTYKTNFDNIVSGDSTHDSFDTEQQKLKNGLVAKAWNAWESNGHWNPDIMYYNPSTKLINFIAPEDMLFWIDFMDTSSDLGKYKISAIGHRAKVINDEKIKAIFYRNTPNILWMDQNDPISADNTSISYVRLRLSDGLSNYFKLSSQGKNAKDELDTLIYECTSYQESITVSCVPIYWFEPNQRIRVVDIKTGISGEYIIKSFSYQLKYDGMMSIQASKAVDRLI